MFWVGPLLKNISDSWFNRGVLWIARDVWTTSYSQFIRQLIFILSGILLRGIDPYDRNERFCLGAIRNINRDFNDEKRKTTHIRNHLGQKDKCLVFSRDSKGKGKVLNSKRLNENFKFGLRTEMLKVFRFLFKVEIWIE